MKKGLVYIFILSSIAFFSACTQKMTCPAYHSYFILDVDETRKTFTMFGEDSLPKKRWEVEKEKYGIAKEIPEQQKLKEMRIISMNSIYKKLEDPFDQFQREFARADSSMYIDSAAVMAKSQNYNDFQNIDQMIYLHHFGKYLPKKEAGRDLLKEDLKVEEKPIIDEESLVEEEPKSKKKKLWPFGKKKKNSEEAPLLDDE